MTDRPIRVQLKRTKGWKMPPNTVVVSRPSAFGNPFTVADLKESGRKCSDHTAREICKMYFIDWLKGDRRGWMGDESDAAAVIINRLPGLRGKNLACWCPLDAPCHADVLLEMANG